MKPKGLMFRPEMVRALLAGTKTQTRRLIKPQPDNELRAFPDEDREPYWHVGGFRLRSDKNPLRPPHPVGSEIWVKETWGLHRYHDFTDWNTKSVSGQSEDEVRTLWDLAYRADMNGTEDCHWRSSTFMPRWASRITLEVTDVRVQRLQDISDEDAIAEGMVPTLTARALHGESLPAPAYTQYADLWESINGPGSWDANPWVWAYTFRVKK